MRGRPVRWRHLVDQNIIPGAANFGPVNWQGNSALGTTMRTSRLQEVVRRALDIGLALLLFVLLLPREDDRFSLDYLLSRQAR